jgi:DNA-binding LytR/AlgR family response regulator
VKALIVDDEKAARDRMARLLERHTSIEIVGVAQDGVEALAKTATLSPDVLFLDVEMPALDGIGVARVLGANGPRIVFVTAFNDFALAAFENAAIDYLLKPVSEERLAKTMARLKSDPRRQLLPEALSRMGKASDRFAIKSGAEYHVLDATRVTAIVAEDHYSVVKGLKTEIICDETLDALSMRLDENRFIRTHRSALVNLAAVTRLEREGDRKYVLVLNDGTRVAISRDRLGVVRRALGIVD